VFDSRATRVGTPTTRLASPSSSRSRRGLRSLSPTPSRLRSTSSPETPSPFPPVRCRDAATGGRSRSRCFGAGPLSDWEPRHGQHQPAEIGQRSPETPMPNPSGSDVQTALPARQMRSTRAHAPTGQHCEAALNGVNLGGPGQRIDIVSRGLGPAGSEPTAYLTDSRFRRIWTLTQVNTVLFLRGLRVSGRFDRRTGIPWTDGRRMRGQETSGLGLQPPVRVGRLVRNQSRGSQILPTRSLANVASCRSNGDRLVGPPLCSSS